MKERRILGRSSATSQRCRIASALFAATITAALLAFVASERSFAATSLIAAYNFDASSGVTLADQSDNGYDGILTNGPTWTSGEYGTGLAFDGADDYVSMGDLAQADGLTGVSVSTWVKFAAVGGGAVETHLVDKSHCDGVPESGPWELGTGFFAAHKAEFVIYPLGGNPEIFLASGSSVTSIDDGAWHHVTGRYDGVDISIWVDGTLESSRAAPGLRMSNSASGVELGGHCNGHSYPFRGVLDDVRIYGRALSPSEILTDIATPLSSAPVPPAPTDAAAPSTPTGLFASDVTTSEATLSWQTSTDNVGVAGYQLYRDGVLAATTSSTGFTDVGLSPNATYVFAVAAFDAAGNASPQAAPLSVTTLPLAPPPDSAAPSTPTGVSVSGVTTSQATLSWQASTDNVAVAGYRVYRDGVLAATTSLTSFTDSGLAPDASYVFAVAAFDAAGNGSALSTPRSVTTLPLAPPPDSTAPSTPLNLAASGVTTSQATVSWQASTDNVGVAGYRLYRDGVLAAAGSSTAFTSVGLSPNTSYVFAVAAFDAAGNASPQSIPLSVTTAPLAPPPDSAAPSTPTGLSTSGVTTSQATLSWQASTDNVAVAGYRLYRDGALVATTSLTSSTDTGLAANTSYVFAVAAFDAAGNSSPQSDPRSATTSAAVPPSGPAPIAAYDFDAGSGGTLDDRSGNAHRGTLLNGPTWTSGKYGSGLTFDGVDDVVSMGDVAPADDLTSITVSAWVRFAVSGGGAVETHLVDKSRCNGLDNAGPWELGVSFTRAHKAEFVIYPQDGNPGPFVLSGASVTSVDDGTWHYLTGRYDGANLSIWVDGRQESSTAVAGLAMTNTAYRLELGGHCNGYVYPFKGTLDDIRLYDQPLTESEILADMAIPVSSSTAPPVADTAAPSTPADLIVPRVTSTQITLSWQASTDDVAVAGYRVYRDSALVATVISTDVTDTGLAPDTSYAFSVSAFDAAGNGSALSASLSVKTSASSSVSYTTTFDAAENPISETGVWHRAQNIWTDVETVDGVAFGTNGVTDTFDDSYALLSGFGPDQTAEAVVYRDDTLSPGRTHEVELMLRASDDYDHVRGYECLFDYAGGVQIVRWDGDFGAFTYLELSDQGSLGRELATGDVIKAAIVGTEISVYINDVPMGHVNDSTFATGQPGISFFARPDGSPRLLGLTSYSVGSAAPP